MKTLAIIALAGVAGAANAQDLLDYAGANDFGAGSAARNVAANLTGNDLFAGSGVNSTTNPTFNYNGWGVGNSLADAVAQDEFFSFGFDVDAGYQVDLTDFDIRFDRSGSGPDDVAIFLWGGDLASSTEVLTHDFNDSGAGITFANVDLSSLGTLTGTVEFRLYAFNAESALGTFDLESFDFPEDDRSIVIRGNVSLIPTPASAGMLALGGLLAARRRR
ncbi:MAG: hypothetical protein AAF356_01500 [Planctomycetota bacterium]